MTNLNLSKFLGTLATTVITLWPGAALSAAVENDVPTFSTDVAPIFKAKCEACHRAEEPTTTASAGRSRSPLTLQWDLYRGPANVMFGKKRRQGRW